MTDLQKIMDIVTEVTGLSREYLARKSRNIENDIIRGVFYTVANSEGYKPKEIAEFMNRSRVNVYIVIHHFKGYIQTGDPRTVRIYNLIKERL